MNEIQIFNNGDMNLQVRTIVNDDGSISINAEDTAIGFGWFQKQNKNGKQYISVRWETVNRYCEEFGFPNMLGKDDYIPEPLFYRLGMKASNEAADKFQNWLAFDVIPSIRKTGGYTVPKAKSDKSNDLAVKEMNARVRMSNQFLKLAKEVSTLSPTYKNIMVAKSAEALAGELIIPLPEAKEKTYSATEIGKMLGVSAHKIGRLANANGLKTDEYGEWYHDKSRYSSKEVDSFRYNDKAVEKFRKLLRE